MIFTIRTRLAASIVVVVLAMGVVSTIVGTRLFGGSLVKQVQRSVEGDLSTAYLLYDERTAETLTRVRFVATAPGVARAVADGNTSRLTATLAKAMATWDLDVLTMTDARGRVVARGGNPGTVGDDRSGDPIVSRILRTGEDVSGTILVSSSVLAGESPDAAGRARIPLVETPRARPTDRAFLDNGMLMAAGVPVIDRGEVVGVLYGAVLLNGRDDIVDQVANTAYGAETWNGKRVGTATIFCDDVRIATTVRDEKGERAVGTRVSGEVYGRVVEAGERWTARAFVVDDWYITAYGPMKDIDGTLVGILYVGVLADRFDALRRQTVLTFAAVSVAGMVLALFIASFLAGGILRPVRHLAEASRQIARGNLHARVQVDPNAAEELVELADAFNIMAKSIADRDERLIENARKMSESRRLATLGQLAAGIAHEINNPLGGIVMYSHMLKEELQKQENRDNIEKIAREADRCKKIVKGLLDFARQTKPERSEADLNHVLDEVIGLLEHQTSLPRHRRGQEPQHERPARERRQRPDAGGVHEHHPERGAGHGRPRDAHDNDASDGEQKEPSRSRSGTPAPASRRSTSTRSSSPSSRPRRSAEARASVYRSPTVSWSAITGPSGWRVRWERAPRSSCRSRFRRRRRRCDAGP